MSSPADFKILTRDGFMVVAKSFKIWALLLGCSILLFCVDNSLAAMMIRAKIVAESRFTDFSYRMVM